MIRPEIEYNFGYISMIIGLIGTTIAPWMQFYIQSAVIEKGLKIENYKYTIADVLVGCIATVVVAFFIMVACGFDAVCERARHGNQGLPAMLRLR